MNYIKSLQVTGLVLTALGILVSCQIASEKPAVDRSILTDDPCAAPCWQGIIPGETTAAEASDILEGIEFIDSEKLWSSGGENFAWHSQASEEDPAIASQILSRAGIVSFIDIGLDFELTLEEVVDKYGPPEKYLAYVSDRVERIQTEIHFFYPQQGLLFTAWVDGYVSPSEPFMLEATTLLTFVNYFAPTSVDELLDEYPELKRRIQFGEEYWKDWQGYGPVELLR